ncbi:M56 family metallopeptidase [Yeosuana sp. AK3]
MLQYIMQTIAFQTFFLLVFDVFLRKETFFNWNRLYLIFTAVISTLLPFVKVESFKNVIPEQYIIRLPEVFIGEHVPQNTPQITYETINVKAQPLFSWELLLYVGMFLAALLFVFKIGKIGWLLYKNPKNKMDRFLIVKLINSSAAFSFFNYIFLGERLSEHERESILQHEMVHVKQKHTLDLLFFEVLRIVFWFNPLVYMYQNRLMTVHEFIADASAVKHQNKSDYYQNLLSQVFETKNISFINPFFKQSLIKKRIVMLQKSKSNQVNLFKYALLIPMVVGMLVYTSSEAQETIKGSVNQDISDKELVEKLILEYNDLNASGVDFKTISDAFMIKSESYFPTKEEYYRMMVFMNKLVKSSKKLLESSISNLDRTYDEYLKWRKTDEAKEKWENNTNDGILKLVVNDIKNLTAEEENRKKDKIDLIKKDYFFNALIVSDGFNSYKIDFSNNGQKETHKVVENVQKTPLIEKIKAIKNQIQIQGNTNEEEDRGLNLLLKIAKQSDLDMDLVNEVQAYISKEPKTDLTKKISDVFEQIQAQGTISEDENTALKELLILTSDDGFNDPFFADVIKDIEVPFGVIDQVPVFPGCESLTSNIEQKDCMSKEISMFVNKNFNTNIGKKNGLVGKQRLNVIFKINQEGNIVDVRSRAPHPALEAEAIRVIKMLPKMLPGKQRGKVVTVPYSLPIIFMVSENKIKEKSKND